MNLQKELERKSLKNLANKMTYFSDENIARVKKHILVSRCLKTMTPYVEKDCIVLDGYPIKYTQKRWDNLFKQYDLSKIPNFDWMKFIEAKTHREQYIVLVNHLDNLS